MEHLGLVEWATLTVLRDEQVPWQLRASASCWLCFLVIVAGGGGYPPSRPVGAPASLDGRKSQGSILKGTCTVCLCLPLAVTWLVPPAPTPGVKVTAGPRGPCEILCPRLLALGEGGWAGTL